MDSCQSDREKTPSGIFSRLLRPRKYPKETKKIHKKYSKETLEPNLLVQKSLKNPKKIKRFEFDLDWKKRKRVKEKKKKRKKEKERNEKKFRKRQKGELKSQKARIKKMRTHSSSMLAISLKCKNS